MSTPWSRMFDDAPVAILITEGREHVVRYANLAFCRFVATACEQLIGRSISETIPTSISRSLAVLIDNTYVPEAPRAKTTEESTAQQLVAWTAAAWPLDDGENGDRRTIVHVTLSPPHAVPKAQYDAALEEIRAINSQLVLSNVRAQELLEEAERASRAKDDFLAMLGHELRNPLAPIRNSVEILRRAELRDPKMAEAREMIARQVSHMARLVDDLLDVSRLAHGKISLRKERLDVVEVVRGIIEDYRTNFEAARLSVNPVLSAEPLWIVGDRTRITQIIGNILHNAIKFSAPGGQVGVFVTAHDALATISVRDTGAGMDPQMVRDAFELFRQADNTLSRTSGGLGVGLSLAKALVTLHHGDIRAASKGLGKGSEFTVSLPLTHRAGISAQPCAAAHREMAGTRVLVVEDNVDAAESMRVLLQLNGHSVEIAHSGREALSAAREFHPDVVLCDIGLPGDMDGYAVARAIRDDPQVPTPRMIAITGYGQDRDVRLAHEAGFDQHLTKPVEPERLYAMLRHQRPL